MEDSSLPPPSLAFQHPPKGPLLFPALLPLQPGPFLLVVPPGCWQPGGGSCTGAPTWLRMSQLAGSPLPVHSIPTGIHPRKSCFGMLEALPGEQGCNHPPGFGPAGREKKPWQHVTPFLEHLRSAGFSYRKLPVLCVEPGLGFFPRPRFALPWGTDGFAITKEGAACRLLHINTEQALDPDPTSWHPEPRPPLSPPPPPLLPRGRLQHMVQTAPAAAASPGAGSAVPHGPAPSPLPARWAGDKRPSGALPLLLSLRSPRDSLHTTTA